MKRFTVSDMKLPIPPPSAPPGDNTESSTVLPDFLAFIFSLVFSEIHLMNVRTVLSVASLTC